MTQLGLICKRDKDIKQRERYKQITLTNRLYNTLNRGKTMQFDTKDKMRPDELDNLLNQLGKDQGYTTPEAWDEYLHSYCSSLIFHSEDF